MAVIYQKEIGEGTRLGVWDIDEDREYLLSRLRLNAKEREFLNSIKNEERYLHWLGSRVLLKELLQTEEFVETDVAFVGKPIIKNLPYNISISHSTDYAGVIVSRDYNVAIDIEFLHPRIERVAHKFMERDDLDRLTPGMETEEMYVHWCSKEVLYKLYGKGSLNFKQDIILDPFDYDEKGHFIGKVVKPNESGAYKIYYERLDDYMLAYTIDNKAV